jgi:ACS family pantothenate transporter-like MFS transporter
VVAGFNVIVFAVIAILAHREKLRKKRNHQLQAAAISGTGSESGLEESTLDAPVLEADAKKIALGVQAVEIRNA